MKIALIGYGKMGKAIEAIALNRGHEISFKISIDNQPDLLLINPTNTDVAIEFTQPESAFDNLKQCIENSIPVVCGSTGWLENKPAIEKLTIEKNTSFFYASNFSVGVNIFFHLNKVLAKLMSGFSGYEIGMEEIHHTEKKDAPSGTAITLAEGILENNSTKTNWVNSSRYLENELPIASKRIENVPGTHVVAYNSVIDSIEIAHTAHSREGFALGAVLAAEFIATKKGVFGMDDMLKF